MESVILALTLASLASALLCKGYALSQILTIFSDLIGNSRIAFGDFFEAYGLVSFLVVGLSAWITYGLVKPLVQRSGKAVLKTLASLGQED